MKKLIISVVCCMMLIASTRAEVPAPSPEEQARRDALARAKTASKTVDEWRRAATGHSTVGLAFMAVGASSIIGGFAWNSEAKKGKEAADKYPSGAARDLARETADRYASHAKTQFLVGGGFLIVGAILNLQANGERKQAKKLELKPYVAPGGKQLGLALRF